MSIFQWTTGPSRRAFRTAHLLGQQMAREDSRLQPRLTGAARHPDYAHFRHAHRELLECSEDFFKWNEHLLALAEQEAHRRGAGSDDSMRAWETWYNDYVQPLKSQMWLAWEAWHDLPALYHQVQRELPLHSAARPSPLESEDRPAPICVAATVAADRLMPAPRQAAAAKPPSPAAAANTPASPAPSLAGSTATNDGPSWSI